ncbi:serine/threonine protein kinase [Anaerocolumna xylanovorans]|uniref:Serine/threonine protein kinase n=1 Tax=Anaerocolumna xylanovorans DSM 12503 TaxID=1121345 RepID=A0A1M7YJM4_9FIRM|nr:serine/threonine-protein kinase [Anaerocolumna xylanovorans]SHO52814.1 serine/threonine protein kinase [Anaerocolumna xylanovorans DSM 12503]
MLEIGMLVDGKYKVLNKIGQGGMSVVYLAMNEKANKQWAIKEVRKDGIKDFEVVKQGLIVETDLLKKLDHPNLPSIIDVIEEKDTLLIVMDYIQGNPLSKYLEEYGAQPQKDVIEWAKQLCDVLAYLHSRKPPIIYRDMKPANVMLKPDGSVTLIDFGTAREFKERNLADTTCLGTIGYAAPEQFGGQGQTDVRTDIYCLGATLYHLVTGHNPCEPPYEILPIREINPGLSNGLEKIILKCTQKNPDDRYQSCEELMYALEHYDEMDDLYKRKQKKRLGTFIGVAMLSLICIFVSAFGYVSAESKQGENYDIMLAKAKDTDNSEEQRLLLYTDAIGIDPANTKAYMEIIDLFLNGDSQEGSFSKEEANYVTRLKAGVDVKEAGGYLKTIYPLDELKKADLKGYQEVCFEIAMLYWYDYEVTSDRYTLAVEWFREAGDVNAMAALYCDIGECQQQIKKYAGQNRTEKMYETYKELWEKLTQLKREVQDMEDSDIKLLVWKELITVASDKAAYFAYNIGADEIIGVIEDIKDNAVKLKKETKYDDLKNAIDNVVQLTGEAEERIRSAYK